MLHKVGSWCWQQQAVTISSHKRTQRRSEGKAVAHVSRSQTVYTPICQDSLKVDQLVFESKADAMHLVVAVFLCQA